MNKRKIFNDPVYGFVTIPFSIIFDLIEHPWFQRLRRIKQLGLTEYVYPGALHTRFHHALGAMHLMTLAINTLRSKGHAITEEEAEAATIAILLHDIGHGPYSHTLEKCLIPGVSHEQLSQQFIHRLNEQFQGKLSLAEDIFLNRYPKTFLHQLVSSQLDVDRLDYLNRDSFFTGVHEGVIGYDRIINMMEVSDNQLVIESKGIYSIEKFLIARRLMYWQVYLHKTVVAAEQMLIMILKRAMQLSRQGSRLFAGPALDFFLKNEVSESDFENRPAILEHFARLDDLDVFLSVKYWAEETDPILSTLCKGLRDRRLLKVSMRDTPWPDALVQELKSLVSKRMNWTLEETGFVVFTDHASNAAYNTGDSQIQIQYRKGDLRDIATASDQLNISVLSTPVTKFFLCYPEWVREEPIFKNI